MTLFPVGLLLLSLAIAAAVVDEEERQEEVHFNYQTDNGHRRSEDITYKVKVNPDKQTSLEPNELSTPKSVEYRGGYSFISADGYEYQVLYKANQNGFQPYVTAHKVKTAKESS